MTNNPEDKEYFCEVCGNEISYTQWLMCSGTYHNNEGFCQQCYDESILELFEEE